MLATNSLDTKAKMYKLYDRNRFGNRLRVLSMPQYFQAVLANSIGPVALRVKTPGRPGHYHLSWEEVLEHYDERFHSISEQAPDDDLTIQGEIQRDARGWYLYYTTMPGYTMKAGLPLFGRHARGLRALSLIRTYLDPAAYDDMMELFDTWPDAVVEFSCYTKAVGWANQNTIFWEVRVNY